MLLVTVELALGMCIPSGCSSQDLLAMVDTLKEISPSFEKLPITATCEEDVPLAGSTIAAM